MNKSFGDFFKQIRISKEITLREFCKLTNNDPSNWSKVERGLLAPPKTKEEIISMCKAIGISEKGKEINTLIDLAVVSFIPKELASEEMLNQLPVFFRNIRGEKLNSNELSELANIITKS